MKNGAWVLLAALTLSACGPSSPDDAMARQALEDVRTGRLDAVTALVAPEQLQTPMFVDQLFRISSQFPGYPPETLSLEAVQNLPEQGRTQLTYHYVYADEILPADVILTHPGTSEQARIETVTLGAPILSSDRGHFWRSLGMWPWVILGGGAALVGVGLWWRTRRARKQAEQAEKERHERRRRRRERRKQKAASETPAPYVRLEPGE